MKPRLFLAVLGSCLAACAAAVPAQTPSSAVPLLPLPSRTPAPAVTPQLPTSAPPPTYTPTPTPTPVIYVVKKGDTLGGIAYTYGISVEVLQAANPGVLPAFLSIGTALTIPISAESGVSIGAAVVASPTPVPVTLRAGPACYPLTTGALYCLVEARNPGATPLQNVAVQIALVGPQGEVLASEVAYSALEVILPGSGSPLAALFPGAPPALAAPVAQVVSAEPVLAGAPAISLDISSPQLAPPLAPQPAPAALWTVTGQVRNESSSVRSVRLVLTLYDAQQRVVGYRQEILPGGLAAGASQRFSISAASLGGRVEGYAVVAEGKP